MKLQITPAFNTTNAYHLALASQLAYQSEQTIRNALMRWHFQHCNYIEQNDTQCFIAEHSDYTLIAFRGTEININDWLTDFNFSFKDCSWGSVHSGFDQALNCVWKNITDRLNSNQNKPVFITGHSLGAALAGLCAARLKLSGIDVTAVYTFGQPRMGDHVFSDNYNQLLGDCSHRIVNNNDIVTRIPPRSLGYSHAGTLQYFKETGYLSDNTTQWQLFLDRLHGRVEDILTWGTDGTKDHSIKEYVRLCEQQLLREIDN